jgi:hypothetical protein
MSIGIDTQIKLKDFLKTVAEEELQVERQRQYLAKISEFEPYAAFQRVNRNGDGRVTALEIYSFLRYTQHTTTILLRPTTNSITL